MSLFPKKQLINSKLKINYQHKKTAIKISEFGWAGWLDLLDASLVSEGENHQRTDVASLRLLKTKKLPEKITNKKNAQI